LKKLNSAELLIFDEWGYVSLMKKMLQ
jgi:hypothetical protein